MQMHDITPPLLHLELLLTEWHEQVFHQPPIEERPVIVYPRDLQISKISDLSQRCLRSSDQTFFAIQIQKDIQLVSHAATFRHITRRQKNLSRIASIQIHAEIHGLNHPEAIHLS